MLFHNLIKLRIKSYTFRVDYRFIYFRMELDFESMKIFGDWDQLPRNLKKTFRVWV